MVLVMMYKANYIVLERKIDLTCVHGGRFTNTLKNHLMQLKVLIFCWFNNIINKINIRCFIEVLHLNGILSLYQDDAFNYLQWLKISSVGLVLDLFVLKIEETFQNRVSINL